MSAPDCVRASMLNHSERGLLRVLTAFCANDATWLTVSPQVSYGAFLNTRDQNRWREISRKRADFVLWSQEDGFVYAVVEFDGSGHWGRQKDEYEAARNADLVKNHACSSAGIPIIRVLQDYAPSAVRDTLREALAMKERRRWWSPFRRKPAEVGRLEPTLRSEPLISTDYAEP
ncbi:MAG: hypothetical protein DI556_13365 [Rhodovulum sulfidophilum]|uniref:DUF2726 domain-containing protein n=1 Tax=Rhodovulum sulfidophilum TaxID=35806 RepID=A0A2W5N8E7_RHOSU|nr:MAG: hypothetical protein DI556_13365 [Rhodovulum sulfidophilum]